MIEKIKAKDSGKKIGVINLSQSVVFFSLPLLPWVIHATAEMGACFLKKGQVVCRMQRLTFNLLASTLVML